MLMDSLNDHNVVKLFEDHTINEIGLILKHVQNEGNRKQSELRTLVGERYRNLMDAVDTIAKMGETSKHGSLKIHEIHTGFSTLQQKYVTGFKVVCENEVVVKPCSAFTDSAILQLKILMNFPEQIWMAIDSTNFLLAAQLYVLVQHIYFSLSFESGNVDISKKYWIAAKQWGILHQFKNMINNGCNDALQATNLSKELAANCLSSSVLLNGTSMSDLTDKLITLRSNMIHNIIASGNNCGVRNCIKLCLNVLNETAPLMYNCFYECDDIEGGLVSYYVNVIKDIEARCMFSQLDIHQELVDAILPEVIKVYKPFSQTKFETDLSFSFQEKITNWVKWVQEDVPNEISKLLNMITSIKGVNNIRKECFAVNSQEKWNLIWKRLNIPSIQFWNDLIYPLLTERVNVILNEKLKTNIANLKQNIINLPNKLASDPLENSEYDLRPFVWNDSLSDIPKNVAENELFAVKAALQMKTSGFWQNVIKMCSDFDQSLFDLLEDLNQYLHDDQQMSTLNDDSLKASIISNSKTFSDHSEIQEYLQKMTVSLIDEFMMFIKERCVSEDVNGKAQNNSVVVIARFLQGMTVLCPNLQKYFTKTPSLLTKNIKWQSIRSTFIVGSSYMWSTWAQNYNVCNQLREPITNLPTDSSQLLRADVFISDWEKVTIVEEAEEGKRIQSEILIPFQPSFFLQQYLVTSCTSLNKFIPHTIPKVALHIIIDKIIINLLDQYKNISSSHMCQKQAIQTLFDVKYITLLMVPRENKMLVEYSNSVCNNIASKIDPFDYDVFYPFIHTNVKKAVQRGTLIYGSLISHPEQLYSSLGARGDQNSDNDSNLIKDPPGILALCSTASWFPSLTVTIPSKTFVHTPVTAQSEKALSKKKISSPSGKSDYAGTTFKSGAAAFFGSMGSDWFSSSKQDN